MKKKILYITSKCPFDNWEVWAIGEINSLEEAGAEVVVVPRTAKGRIMSVAANELLKKTIVCSFISREIILTLFYQLLFRLGNFSILLVWIFNHSNSMCDFLKSLYVLPKSLYLAKICRNKGFTHVHAFSTTTVAVVAYIIAHELNVSWSITFHSAWHLDKSHYNSTIQQLKSSSFVRAISKITMDSINSFTKSQYSDKLVMLHLGMNVDYTKPKTWHRNNVFVISSVGWLLPHKGVDISLQTVKLIIDKGITNFRWDFYGEGPLRQELLEKAKSLNINEFVNFKGNVENSELLELYNDKKIDLLIQNSVERYGISEGIPVSIMEAMAYEIPVIATDCGGTRELVDGKSGILIRQNDPISLCNKIIEIMNNSEMRIQFSQNGKKKIIAEFESKKIALKLLKHF